MNYAIQNIRKFKNHFPEVKEFIELFEKDKNAKPRGVALELIQDLKKNIEIGLNGWGDNYQEEKKRQQKRLAEVSKILE